MKTITRYTVQTPPLQSNQVAVGLVVSPSGKYVTFAEHEEILKLASSSAPAQTTPPDVEKVTALEEKISELEQIKKNLDGDLASRNEECEVLRSDCEKASAKIKELQDALTEASQKYDDLAASIAPENKDVTNESLPPNNEGASTPPGGDQSGSAPASKNVKKNK